MDLFEEIRSDLNKTRYLRIWNKYGKFFIITLVVMVVGLVSALVMRQIKIRNDQEAGGVYLRFLENTNKANFELALENLDELQKLDSSNYIVLSKIRRGTILLMQNKISDSFKIFKIVLSDPKGYKPYRDYAELMLHYIKLRFPTEEKDYKFDSSKVNPSNIFYYTILEVRALNYIERKLYKNALDELNKIASSKEAPASVRTHAATLIQIVEAENGKK